MSTRFVRLFLVFSMLWFAGAGFCQAQETESEPTSPPTPTGSTFPNRYTGRQIILAVGSSADRPEYRLLDNGLLFYREGSEGPFKQLGQKPKATIQQAFAALEQECKIKTARVEAPAQPDTTLVWKKAKTEYSVAWERKNAPDAYAKFVETFKDLFSKKTTK
ncbi:hypothetical protein [Larkinella soli]|uniref:hypothetical protein n=1 Tax=Larkinella soli TaxID=1770527 RepID=UPI000FFBC18C|nr:hypothetical protein [Larkinella soli]